MEYLGTVFNLFTAFVEAGFDPFVASWIVGICFLMVIYFIFQAFLHIFK